MPLIDTVLRKMSNVFKPQRMFLIVVLTTIMYLPGKANFRNLSRYSEWHEKTYSRGFRRSFDFVEFMSCPLFFVFQSIGIMPPISAHAEC